MRRDDSTDEGCARQIAGSILVVILLYAAIWILHGVWEKMR